MPGYFVASLRNAFVSSISDGWQWRLYNCSLFVRAPVNGKSNYILKCNHPYLRHFTLHQPTCNGRGIFQLLLLIIIIIFSLSIAWMKLRMLLWFSNTGWNAHSGIAATCGQRWRQTVIIFMCVSIHSRFAFPQLIFIFLQSWPKFIHCVAPSNSPIISHARCSYSRLQ